MTQHEISSLKTYFDEIAETNGDNECRAWLDKLFDSKAELASFVASRRGGGAGQFIGFLRAPSISPSASASVMEGRTPLFGFQNRDIQPQL